jgi:hypothetical protein
MRCYQEFREETHLPLDIPAMIEGMERFRARGTAARGKAARGSDHTCL